MTKYEDTEGRWKQEIERRLRALETGPRAPYTSIPDDEGRELVRLSHEGLDVFDPDTGDNLVDIGAGGIIISEGAIWVGGGPVRAIDYFYGEGDDQNVTVSSPPTKLAVETVTPPSWVTTVVAQCLVLFQMSNNTGSDLVMEFRATVNGQPPSGAYSASVPVGRVVNVVDSFQATLVRGVDFTTSFECAGYLGVQSGSQSDNVVRSKVSAVYLR